MQYKGFTISPYTNHHGNTTFKGTDGTRTFKGPTDYIKRQVDRHLKLISNDKDKKT